MMPSSRLDLCIKCNNGGNLLVCNGDDCPIVVHEKCMGCPARRDDAGKYYCPYCMSRKAYVELNQAREDARLKKRALSTFINATNMDKELSGNDKKKMKSPVGETRNVQSSDHLHKENNPLNCKLSGDQLDGDKEVADNQEKANLSGVEEKASEGEKDGLKSLEENENREKNHDKTATSKENDSILEEQAHKTSNKISKEHKPLIRRSERIKGKTPCEPPSSKDDCSGRSSPIMGKCPRKIKKTIAPSKLSSPCEPPSPNVDCSRRSSPRIPKSPRKIEQAIDSTKVNSPSKPPSSNVGCSGRSSPRIPKSPRKTRQTVASSKPPSSNVDCSGRSLPIIRKSPRKTNKTNITSEVSQNIINLGGLRRLLWTEEEEEMIKKGVEKYTSDDNKNLLWKNILDFG